MRADAVSPDLALYVLKRDAGCMAPRLGGDPADCWGRNRIEHVKADLRMGKRAEPRADRLLTLCEGHTEPGMRAGYVWATDKVNRQAMRAYLARITADLHARVLDTIALDCVHVEPAHGCPSCRAREELRA